MNKLQSQVRGIHWLGVLLPLCLQLMKREGEFSGILQRQKKQGGEQNQKQAPTWVKINLNVRGFIAKQRPCRLAQMKQKLDLKSCLRSLPD